MTLRTKRDAHLVRRDGAAADLDRAILVRIFVKSRAGDVMRPILYLIEVTCIFALDAVAPSG
jgi:hypothetical protein